MAKERYEYSDKHKSPTFVGAFVRIFEADDNGKYGLTAITSKEDATVFRKAMKEAADKCWPGKADSQIKHPKFRSPFRDGAEMVNRDGELYNGFAEGQVVVKLSSKDKPGIVDRMARAIKDKDGTTLTDKEAGTWEEIEDNKIYSGASYRATFVAQAYDREDGFGVSFKLENLQKVKDGDRLGGGGRAKAEDEFEPIGDVSDDEFMA